MSSALILLSGGMDSTALLSEAIDGLGIERVETLSVIYGQRHVKEIEQAKLIAAHYGVKHDVVDLSVLADFLDSALTSDDKDVPDGHYAEQTMRITVVPNRNAIMLMVAGGIAASRGIESVWTAVHAGDHFIYPDCRPEFIDSASNTLSLGTSSFGDVKIIAPFVMVDKTEIAKIGNENHAPFALSWSCYKGSEIHCGACGTCFERREAFDTAGIDDPTIYAATPMYDAPK